LSGARAALGYTLVNQEQETDLSDLGIGLVTLATATITGGVALLGVHLTNRATAERNNQQLRHGVEQKKKDQLLEKAEELYQLTDRWLSGFSTHFLHLVPVMRGQTDYNCYLDAIIEYGKSQNEKFVRIEMLLHIYFTELSAPYESVLEEREAYNEIITRHKQAYKQGDMDGVRFIEPFTKAALEIERRGQILKSAIAEVARRIGNQYV
jgi:hypothetical protein